MPEESWTRLPRRLIPGLGPPPARQAPSSTTRRLEAFSDGVIAIVITLLVLEISVPHAPPGKLLDALRATGRRTRRSSCRSSSSASCG